MPANRAIPTTTAFPGARILIVDDERALRHMLAKLFEHVGYHTTEAASGREAIEIMGQQRFDLVTLDLNMPEMDGVSVMYAARPLAPDTVFIILTAHGTLDSAIAAVRCGAYDYLLKPSPVNEIVRAVEAGLQERQRRLGQESPVTLLERALASLKKTAHEPQAAGAEERFLQTTHVTVDTLKQLVMVRGQPVTLTATEFQILAYLMRHRERVVPCRELVAHVRGYEMDERDARVFLRSHVHRLRQKLERDPSRPGLIDNVRSEGYTFVDGTQPQANRDPSQG